MKTRLLKKARIMAEDYANLNGAESFAAMREFYRMVIAPQNDVERAVAARYIGLLIISENQEDECIGYDPLERQVHILDPEVRHDDYGAEHRTLAVYRRIGNGRVPNIRRLQPVGFRYAIESRLVSRDSEETDRLHEGHTGAILLMIDADCLVRKLRKEKRNILNIKK